MKKNTFVYLLACGLCLFLLSACFGSETGRETIRIRSYVVMFGEPNTFRMHLTGNNNIALFWEENIRWVTFRDGGLDGVRYDKLATQYNDLSYNRIVNFIGSPIGRSYVSNEIASINVVSDTDFDAEYPAGTSLAGFVHLLSASPIRFIESGYQETFDWYNNYPVDFLRETSTFHYLISSPFRQNHFPISGVLLELEPNDFRLLGVGVPGGSVRDGWFFGFLVFDKEPDSPGTHNLTVTIRRTNGQTLSQTIEKTFGE